MSESEIRAAVLDSKEFACAVGEQIRDKLEDDYAVNIARTMLQHPATGEARAKRQYELYWAMVEALGPTIEATLNHEIAEFKARDKHLYEVVREPDEYPPHIGE
jgi:hypothetical protein